MKQIYAHTGPTPRVGMAPYLQAFDMGDGHVVIHARHESGKLAALSLPIAERIALAKALVSGLPCSPISSECDGARGCFSCICVDGIAAQEG